MSTAYQPVTTFEMEQQPQQSSWGQWMLLRRRKKCEVCGDNSNNTGYHYGVMVCESCKIFFKRSITHGTPYRCNYSNNCTIDRRAGERKLCRACRLKKCREKGMRRRPLVRPRRQRHPMHQEDGDTADNWLAGADLPGGGEDQEEGAGAGAVASSDAQMSRGERTYLVTITINTILF